MTGPSREPGSEPGSTPIAGAAAATQLARDVIELAKLGGMPDSFWLTDSRIARACATLGIDPETARNTPL